MQKLTVLLYKYFEKLKLKSISRAQDNVLKIREELDQYKKDNTPVTAEIVDVNKYDPPVPGPLPSNDQIKKKVLSLIRKCLKLLLLRINKILMQLGRLMKRINKK